MPDDDVEGDPGDGGFLGALPAGTRLQRYELISVLGHGQFGLTYLARDSDLGREVAIKEYLPVALALRKGGTLVAPRSSALKADFVWGRERFLEEARTLATFDHVPGVVHALDFMEANGTAYMVMALVRGDTLEERLKRDGPLPGPIAERLFGRLLDGLEEVHKAGFLHRDIKPANIILDAQSNPTLIDFGAARISLAGRTAAMTAIYTPRYAAVEQEDTDGRLGPWTDIYCLSATLYHAITGQSPPRAITRALRDTYKPLAELAPAGFARRTLAAIDWGLALEPDGRPQSIAAWRCALTESEALPDRAALDDDGNATIVGPRRPSQAASWPLAAAGASAPPAVPPPVVPQSAVPPPPPSPSSSAAATALPPPGAAASPPAGRRRGAVFAAIILGLILLPAGAYWASRLRLSPAARMDPSSEAAATPGADAELRHKAEAEAGLGDNSSRKAEAEPRPQAQPESATVAAQRKTETARHEGESEAPTATAEQGPEEEALQKMEQIGKKAADAAPATAIGKGSPPPADKDRPVRDIDRVRARGTLLCGVSFGIPGFSSMSSQGKWSGFDVDMCRAVAAAIFGDAGKVKFVATTAQLRFIALLSGEVDMLARATIWTLLRDAALGFDFVGINYYDGQGFMVNKKLGVKNAKQLNGAAICVQPGTTTEQNLVEYFRANDMTFRPVVIEKVEEVGAAFFAGHCDALTYDASSLYSTRARAPNPDDYVILPEIISKEPQGVAVRHSYNQFADIVRWTLRAMIEAEEYGITSQNVDEMLKSEHPTIQRILGVTPGMGKALGVDDRWVYNIVSQVGNYGESFERNLGQGSPLKIDRGLNNLWTKGGLQYAAPIR
jgi:general L-amino acid transport system substrate-binding protein